MRTGSETMDLTVEGCSFGLAEKARGRSSRTIAVRTVSIRPMLASALSRVRRAPRERPR